jgi:hypothetical protein
MALHFRFHAALTAGRKMWLRFACFARGIVRRQLFPTILPFFVNTQRELRTICLHRRYPVKLAEFNAKE